MNLKKKSVTAIVQPLAMKMTMTEDEILGRIKMGVNVDIKRSDGKRFHEFFLYIYIKVHVF